MNGPKVSIIVPIYNVELYLKECIDSILNQTLQDFELILVNDGSTDKSGEICDYYEKLDSRVRVIHKKNGGVSDARNRGIDIANGEYICFIDSDDYIDNNMLKNLYEQCVKYNADISICNSFRVYEDKMIPKFDLSTNEVMDNNMAMNELLDHKKFGFTPWSKLYNIKLFDDIRFPVGKINEDNFTIYKLIGKAQKVACIPYIGYYNRYRENSITYNLKFNPQTYYIESKKELFEYIRNNYPKLEYKAFKIFYSNTLDFIIELVKNNCENKYNEQLRVAISYLQDINLNIQYLSYKEKIRLFIFKICPIVYIKYLKVIYK